METSDSDYFESADEDFCSDDETQIEHKIDDTRLAVTELARKTGNVSVNDDLTCNFTKSDRKVVENLLKTEQIHEKCDKEEKKEKVKAEDGDLIRKTVDTPQDVDTKSFVDKIECWEPGMDYDNSETFCNLKEQSKEPTSTKNIADQSDSETKFHVPPAVSNSDHLDEKLQRKSSSKDEIQQIVKSAHDTKEKPKRPEFGIPPTRTTCWVPGVTNPNMKIPFQPHPAYLKLMKQKQHGTSDESNKPEVAIPPGEPTREISNLKTINALNKPEASSKQGDVEENMWDNEGDWGDFDITNATAKEDNLLDKLADKKENIEQEKNMWDDEDWVPVEPASQNQEGRPTAMQQTEVPLSWSGWGNWGLTSVLSTATSLTSQVSQGLSNVLETGIGAPDPEELAKLNKIEKEKLKQVSLDENIPILGFGLGNLMQGVTKLVETTSTKVISGGLDTLETIGKKTMEVLQENDPGLKKKRAFLKLDDDKPILSQLLREAKEKQEKENIELEKKHFARKANYETLFDDHQGLVHLEALEMLSKQCDIKLQNLLESASGDTLNEMQETLDQVKELCELAEEDEDETLTRDEIKEKLELAIKEININITYKRLLTTWEEVEDWLSNINLKICSKNELHQQAIETLAQLTAIAVEQFHRAGELLLIKDHRSTADEADSLVQLTTTLTALIGVVAGKFSEKLNMIEAKDSHKEEVNSLITNVFFEAANSSSYIQDAFQLLVPVLQEGAL